MREISRQKFEEIAREAGADVRVSGTYGGEVRSLSATFGDRIYPTVSFQTETKDIKIGWGLLDWSEGKPATEERIRGALRLVASGEKFAGPLEE